VITAGSGKLVTIHPEFSGELDFPCLPIIAGSLDKVILPHGLPVAPPRKKYYLKEKETTTSFDDGAASFFSSHQDKGVPMAENQPSGVSCQICGLAKSESEVWPGE
jgi:hypothetical protein